MHQYFVNYSNHLNSWIEEDKTGSYRSNFASTEILKAMVNSPRISLNQ